MNAIGFQNLRSLRNTPDLELKPITVFVGANSSGKSTFLRTLPLLRQSMEARKASPILWYGRFVDFGSFREAVYRNEDNLPIEFRFKFDLRDPEDTEEYWAYPEGFPPISESSSSEIVTVAVSISGTDKEFRGYVSEVVISIRNDCFKISINSEGAVSALRYNDKIITELFPTLKTSGRSNLVPRLGRFLERTDLTSSQAEVLKVFSTANIGTDRLVEKLRPFFSGKAKKETLFQFARRLRYGSAEETIAQIQKIAPSHRILQKRLQGLITNSALIDEVRLCIMLNSLPKWLSAADTEVEQFASTISYVGPVRASTQRYYRAQDLAVDEVDPQGENIPMFLQTLSINDRQSLSQWLTKHFNFAVEAEYSSGHVSLRYKDPEQDRSYNLADMGFGFSQILPILVQIWAQGYQRPKRPRQQRGRARLFAIEQPELHLHPYLQGRFADLLCAVTGRMNAAPVNVRFVIETHSEAIINRLGTLVREQKLSSDDINVVVFERDDKSAETSLRIANYDSSGQLANWPFGFFSGDRT